MSTSKLLPKILIDSKSITQDQLDKIYTLQGQSGKSLMELVVSEAFMPEEELLSVVSYYLNIPFIDVSGFSFDLGIIKMVPPDIARKYNFFPLYKTNDILLIAVCEPLDIIALDNIRIAIGAEIKQVLGKRSLIDNFLSKYYAGSTQSLSDILDINASQNKNDELAPTLSDDSSLDLIQESQKQPVVQAVNLVISEAVQMRASDIHLEPSEEALLVRYRIDGILQEMHSIPKKSQRGISARLKILSGLDITKFYVPQDGRFSFNEHGKDIDFRVSVLPTIYGEKVVLRILDKSNLLIKIEQLGFSEHSLALLKEASSENHGMVLITGPTGSGKTTTLYSALAELNTVSRHIVTVEDPVEYQLDGIAQTQARQDIGLSFAAALRGILRQSPDIIMIGEIRDGDTADIAIKAALTGHLVFSTLHTNDAPSAFVRLIDMGVERYLVASSLTLVCAQRLCRKICPKCKERENDVPLETLRLLQKEIKAEPIFYHGKGCPYCNNSGYRGRVAVLEALKVDEHIKKMVIKEMSSEQIKETAVKEGRLVTLRQDALRNALSGATTLEEVFRTTSGEQ